MDILNNLLIVCSDIENIYKQLYKLEKEGQRESRNFVLLVNTLKKKVLEEDELFKELINSEDYEEIKEYIYGKNTSIYLRMKDYILLYETMNKNNDDETEDECDYCYDNDDELYEDNDGELFEKLGKLYVAISKNIYLVYLSFVEEVITDSELNEIRYRMINVKYFSSFVKHNMEKSLIDYDFKVLMENYIDAYLVSDLLGIDPIICEEAMFDSYLSLIDSVISQILELDDKDYTDYNSLCCGINFQCMFKACLAMLSDYEYGMIKSEIFNMVERLSTDKNAMSIEMINEILINRKKYMSRVKKISMRPLKK